jgi:hypothetical protein
MNGVLAVLTLAAWAAIFVAVKDMYRIKRYGYVKPEHTRSK